MGSPLLPPASLYFSQLARSFLAPSYWLERQATLAIPVGDSGFVFVPRLCHIDFIYFIYHR